jgi:malate dehydrogenase (quinone)
LTTQNNQVDVLLVGGGIMSATLATLINRLDPQLSIQIIERLPNVALESSQVWNNAGTGHAGYCELNYTPENGSGTVDIQRALGINAAFETSLQFWAYLVEQRIISDSAPFITPVPHISFVWGKYNVAFLRERFINLKMHHLFHDMEYSENRENLTEWMPLIMQGRDNTIPVAATRVAYGTDVNFGALTQQLINALANKDNVNLSVNTEVTALRKLNNGRWKVNLKNSDIKETQSIESAFVFLGAGGAALKLLQKSRIPEGLSYGGFPVSGQWLVCNKPEIIAQHHAKVYGKAAIGAPPMSVPHLDTRMINNEPALLFGPYAGFTTKFLKSGSYLDLAKSIKTNNLKAMLGVGKNHLDLTKYLVKESLQSHEDRMATLRQFLPEAKNTDWHLENAGKRVQVIKHCDTQGGKLEFGTEIVNSADGTLAALLGASPGASVATQTMVEVLERCFSSRMQSQDWLNKLKTIIPSYGESLIENAELLKSIRSRNLSVLKLK